MEQTCFSYFLCEFKIKTSVYVWICDEQSRTCEEHIRTFKHIQGNYHALILKSYHDNINKQSGNEIIPSCKIHIMEEGILDGGPKGGGK